MKLSTRGRAIPRSVISITNRMLDSALEMDNIGARMAIEYQEIQLRWRIDRDNFLNMLEELVKEK